SPQYAVYGSEFPATNMISPRLDNSIAFNTKISSPTLEITVTAEPTIVGVGLHTSFISLLNVLRDLIASDTGALEYSLNFSIISEETLSIFVAILYSGKTLSLLIISPPFFIIKILDRKSVVYGKNVDVWM